MDTIRIAMAQINPTVGDISGNSEKILEYAGRARALACDIVLFPELALTGYPPEDLLLKPGFISENLKALGALSKKIRGVCAVVGFVDRKEEIYNAAAIVHKGKVAGIYHKMYLPNYGVFDEQRYFQAGSEPLNFTLNGVKIGVGICEDIWYPQGPARSQALAGAGLIVNINASPYHMGKSFVREEMLITRARDNAVIIAYNNTVGGQDELVFDGRGMIIDAWGNVIARAKAFKEDLLVADIDVSTAAAARLHDTRRREERLASGTVAVREISLGATRAKKKKPGLKAAQPESLESHDDILCALKLGVADYVRKNGFKHVVVGLSGGIDSALVAAIAVDALGKKNVTAVFMPSKYSSKESREDAAALAKNLGIEFLTVPINAVFERYLSTLAPEFRGKKPDTAEENLQARIRGNILMALSNKFGWLVLTTGNKSEMSVGYATLYGDMAGGFALIKDVPKTLVYGISGRINSAAGRVVIPKRIFTKAPTAELKYNQTDQDTLPPYDLLDKILKAYVEDDKSLEEITKMGIDRNIARRVIRMVDLSEYKRRQAPPGVKITPRALGKDRRMPITNGYRN